MRRLFILSTVVVALGLSGCVAISAQEEPEQFMNSAIITSSVKTRLAQASGLETLSLSIETLQGQVLLSGFAQTQEQKDMAGKIANNTEGVKKVINNIVVQ